MTTTIGELMDEEAKACVDRLKARVVELESALAVTSGYVAVERERDQVATRLKWLHETIERAEKAYCINSDYSGETLPIIAALARMASSADTLKNTVRRQNNEIFRMEDKLKEERASHGAEVLVLRRQLEDLRAKRAPPSEDVAWAKNVLNFGDPDDAADAEVMRVARFICEMAGATKPKGKTRAEAVADELLRLRDASEKGLGVFMVIDEARMLCDAAGVNADEEKPEAP